MNVGMHIRCQADHCVNTKQFKTNVCAKIVKINKLSAEINLQNHSTYIIPIGVLRRWWREDMVKFISDRVDKKHSDMLMKLPSKAYVVACSIDLKKTESADLIGKIEKLIDQEVMHQLLI